jgi:hypothetical protein
MRVDFLLCGEARLKVLGWLTTVSTQKSVQGMVAISINAQKFCMPSYLVPLAPSLSFHWHFLAAGLFIGKYVVNESFACFVISIGEHRKPKFSQPVLLFFVAVAIRKENSPVGLFSFRVATTTKNNNAGCENFSFRCSPMDITKEAI